MTKTCPSRKFACEPPTRFGAGLGVDTRTRAGTVETVLCDGSKPITTRAEKPREENKKAAIRGAGEKAEPETETEDPDDHEGLGTFARDLVSQKNETDAEQTDHGPRLEGGQDARVGIRAFLGREGEHLLTGIAVQVLDRLR